jgi:hypothetical protein
MGQVVGVEVRTLQTLHQSLCNDGDNSLIVDGVRMRLRTDVAAAWHSEIVVPSTLELGSLDCIVFGVGA